jgi:hypothetical protein
MMRDKTVRKLVQPFLDAYHATHDAVDDGQLAEDTKITLTVPISAIHDLWNALKMRPNEIEP